MDTDDMGQAIDLLIRIERALDAGSDLATALSENELTAEDYAELCREFYPTLGDGVPRSFPGTVYCLVRGDGERQYGEPFPRQSRFAGFYASVLRRSEHAVLLVTVEHRDPGDSRWSVACSFLPIDAVGGPGWSVGEGMSMGDASPLKELVRYRFEFSEDYGVTWSAETEFLPTDVIHVLMHEPRWA